MTDQENIILIMTRLISYSRRILDYMITELRTERLRQRFRDHGIISMVEASFDLQLSLLQTRKEELLYRSKSLLLPLFQCRNFGYNELEQWRIPTSSLIQGFLSLTERKTNDEYILFLYEYKDATHNILPGSLHLLKKVAPILGNYIRMVSNFSEIKSVPNILNEYLEMINQINYEKRTRTNKSTSQFNGIRIKRF